MNAAAAHGGGSDRTQVHISRDLAVDDEHRFRRKQRTSLAHPAARAQQLVLDRVAQVHAELRAIAQGLAQLVAVVVQVDHDIVQAGLPTQRQGIADRGMATHGKQRFGKSQAESAETSGTASRKNHHLHGWPLFHIAAPRLKDCTVIG